MESQTFNKIGNDFERKKKILESVIENKLDSGVYHATQENSEQNINSDILTKALNSLIKRSKELMPQKDAELSNLYNSIVALRTENPEDFKRVIITRVTEFMLENFSFDEIENMVRQEATMINRLIEYNVHNGEVDIHVPPTFVDKPTELLRLLTDAMKKLAEKFKNDPEFKDVSKVTANSWIVLHSPEILKKKFGFTITFLDEKENTGGAEISREKLLELYSD